MSKLTLSWGERNRSLGARKTRGKKQKVVRRVLGPGNTGSKSRSAIYFLCDFKKVP
jgi:hypothetical protein